MSQYSTTREQMILNETNVTKIAENNDIVSFYLFDPLIQYSLLTSGIGQTFLCLLCFLFIIVYFKHKLIKATCWFISLIIIIALSIGNIPIFLLTLGWPSKFLCTATIFCHALCFGVVYSNIFVKTLRLARIYYQTKKGNRNIRFISNKAVAIQAGTLTLINVCFDFKFQNLI